MHLEQHLTFEEHSNNKKRVSQQVFNAMVREIIVFGPMNQITDRLTNLFENFEVLSEPDHSLTMVKEEALDERTIFRTYIRNGS